jgi:hypothetical protein
MMRRYGLPYKGSKNAIADWVIQHLPESGTLVDLFCGGCAVTHAALLSGKWERIIANDLHGDVPQLFMDAIAGKYTTETEKRWISREDFFRLKDTDAYVRLCWSFGNDSHAYLYAKEIEPFKKRLHELVFADTVAERMSAWRAFVAEFNRLNRDVDALSGKARRLCAECGAAPVERADGSIDAENTRESVFRAHSKEIREYMRAALRDSEKRASDVDRLLGTNGMAGHYFGESQWALPTEEAYEKMKTIIPGLTIPWAVLNEKLNKLESLQGLQSLQSLQGLQGLQRLQGLQSLQSLQGLQGLQGLQVSGLDYRNVKIPGDAVVYCDIPYNCTADSYGVRFDRAAFLDWADIQTAPIIISEYCIDDDRFTTLAEIEKRQLMQGAKHQKKVTERLYCLKRQADEIRARLTLQEKMAI